MTGRKLRVLLIEDSTADIFLLETAVSMIERPEIALTTLEDSTEALAWLTRQQRAGQLPDVVLLDLNMPRLTGLELLDLLRQTPGMLRLPVVVFTTSNAETDRDEALRLGARDFVTKPLHMDSLLDFLEGLERYRGVPPPLASQGPPP